MINVIDAELVTSSLTKAIDRARELQAAGFGLQSAIDIGGGYEFSYKRQDGTEASTLLVPEAAADQPGFAAALCGDGPVWERTVSGSTLSTKEGVINFMLGLPMYRGVEYAVIPHLNVFCFA